MISKNEVERIAKLARLELDEKEIEKMQKDMSAILDYFDVLKKAPRKSAEFNAEKRGRENNVLRKDEVEEKSSSLANNLIGAAPDRKDSYIKVKSIL
mgnify:CR=1 FL=1